MQLTIQVVGRPAPQGSKSLGGAGQLLEQSTYLPAWRAAVKIAAFRAYAKAGIPPQALPVFPAGVPVYIEQLTFRVAGSPTAPPDIDKLLRATLDALGGAKRMGRLYADDAQVVGLGGVSKIQAAAGQTGALIIVSDRKD